MTQIAFTDRELDVMSVLWKNGGGTVSEVRAALADEPGYTTVLKILQILEEKGHVTHEREGRAYRYLPLVEPEAAGASALGTVLNKIYHGSVDLLVAQLVRTRALSSEEIEALRSIVDSLDEGGEDE